VVALMLLMGLASPYWMKTLDVNGASMATTPVKSATVALEGGR